jgi:hypothetical protein
MSTVGLRRGPMLPLETGPTGRGSLAQGRGVADALGRKAIQNYGLKGRERVCRIRQLSPPALAALQAAGMWWSVTQGIGLRPHSWAGLSRPVGPVPEPLISTVGLRQEYAYPAVSPIQDPGGTSLISTVGLRLFHWAASSIPRYASERP